MPGASRDPRVRAHEVFVRRHDDLRGGATAAVQRLTGLTVRGAHRAFLDGGAVGFTHAE